MLATDTTMSAEEQQMFLMLARSSGLPLIMGATCPACGSTNSFRFEVKDGNVVVKVYFQCGDCGTIW